MNFLAHLYLSPPTPDARLGSLLGDFVKGPVERAGYNAEVREAIRLHRRIDTFTDSHPVVCRARARVSPARRRCAGILVDVFFDHFLARDWERHHPLALEAFAAEVYAGLLATGHPLPDRFATMVSHLVRQDWLCTYRHLPGIALTLDRMSRRASRAAPALFGAAEELAEHYDAFAGDFTEYFPAAQAALTPEGGRTPE
ncbi:MAG: DUF479 domain-containing protein [Betaproteobacteria bacterium]|nr:DUF479 domain-containing protein [Betaproteobacteria bacterium]